MTALLGASLNPIHRDHVNVAQFAFKHIPIETLVYVLTKNTPFWKNDLLPMPHRKNMAELAVEELASGLREQIRISTIDESLSGKTVDMVKWYTRTFPNRQFCFVMGSDLLPKFSTWHGWEETLSMVPLFCVPRNGDTPEKLLPKLPPEMRPYVGNHIYLLSPDPELRLGNSASSDVRDQLRTAGFSEQITERTLEYIVQHTLLPCKMHDTE